MYMHLLLALNNKLYDVYAWCLNITYCVVPSDPRPIELILRDYYYYYIVYY